MYVYIYVCIYFLNHASSYCSTQLKKNLSSVIVPADPNVHPSTNKVLNDAQVTSWLLLTFHTVWGNPGFFFWGQTHSGRSCPSALHWEAVISLSAFAFQASMLETQLFHYLSYKETKAWKNELTSISHATCLMKIWEAVLWSKLREYVA